MLEHHSWVKTFPQVTNSIRNHSYSFEQTHIVHVKRPEAGPLGQLENVNLEGWYKSFLPSRIASSDEQQQKRMVCLYKNVRTGFAARLTEEEVQAMEKMDGFVLAHPQRKFRLQTTHTPTFLGLHRKWDSGRNQMSARV